jgi:S-adenosylmethionine-diacylglycerol 3-amino-3-carboxypropyl transferase
VKSEAAAGADFSRIRYAQVWEDADVLLAALDPRPGDRCLSVASAGDNALALLSRGPERVVAVDLSPAQLACLELRVAAFRALAHPELLDLLGVCESARRDPAAPDRRAALYGRIRGQLSEAARAFWDARPTLVRRGAATVGKFERYFDAFRRLVLPLVHSRATVEALLQRRAPGAREDFYARRWDTWRWRLLFRLFFSRAVMGRLGRDPAFFRYVEGSVATRILARTRRALTALDPAENPYLQWILLGGYRDALPFALRPENFEPIRRHLPSLEWRLTSLEDYLETCPPRAFTRCNLSDVFEYMAEPACHALLERLAATARPGARLVYWNMLAPRRRPEALAARLQPLPGLSAQLHAADRGFFYAALVIEEVLP